MENRAVEIACEHWADLRERYLPETPQTILGLSTISNYIRWNKKVGKIVNMAFYSLNGDWSDGTFVLMDRYHLYCDTSSDSTVRLKALLELLDYSKGVRVAHVRSKCFLAVSKVFEQKQLELEFNDSNLLYYLTKEQALTLDIELPDDLHFRSLSASDAAIANNDWRFSTCGIFTRDGNDLISYGFHCPTGPIVLLYTKSEHRNRSYATLVTKILSKQIGGSGCGVTACVSEKNPASRAIFQRIGFKVIDEVYWLQTKHFDWTEETYPMK